MMKKILIMVAMLSLAACSKVSLENYDKISIGMNKAAVETILGNADSCIEKTLHTDCIWGDETKNITITLVSNKVTLYSKHGLANEF